MARRRGMRAFEGGPAGPVPQGTLPLEQSAEGFSLLFGTRRNQKTILKLACILFVLVGFIHFLLAQQEGPFTAKLVVPLLFTALHGGLLGMLLGQVFIVYSDLAIGLCTGIAMFVGVGIYLIITGALDHFVLDRVQFQGIVAVLFWSGFVGFWIGFIAIAKRLSERRRFQKRYKDQNEDPDQFQSE